MPGLEAWRGDSEEREETRKKERRGNYYRRWLGSIKLKRPHVDGIGNETKYKNDTSLIQSAGVATVRNINTVEVEVLSNPLEPLLLYFSRDFAMVTVTTCFAAYF